MAASFPPSHLGPAQILPACQRYTPARPSPRPTTGKDQGRGITCSGQQRRCWPEQVIPLPYIHMRHLSDESTPESLDSPASFGQTVVSSPSALSAMATPPAQVSSMLRAASSAAEKKRASSTSSALGR